MRTRILIICLLILNRTLGASEVVNLRCEYLVNPPGIDVPSPRLSWNIVSSRRGDLQLAWQVIVSSSPELLYQEKGDFWNSGKVNSDQSIQVSYQGKPLKSCCQYYWKVRIWNRDGLPSCWSKPARWSMGPLSKQDWRNAQWIAYKDSGQWKKEWERHKDAELANLQPLQWPNNSWPWLTGKDSTIFTLFEMPDPKYDPSPLFRKDFTVPKRVRSATLFICGLGYHEAYLNGTKVGDHVLDPAWTNFEQRSLYVTHDVTNHLRQGDNTIGVMLGRGQYNPICNDIWGLSKSAWIDQPKVIVLLNIEFTDGTRTAVVSNNTWKSSAGPVVYDDTRHGELYDARLEQKGWSSPSFDASLWKDAAEVSWNSRLESQMMQPIRSFEPILPVKMVNKGKGILICDIGKNISGWARVKVRGNSGARVLVEYCETPADSSLVTNLPLSRFNYIIKDKHYASFYDKGVNVRQQNGYILRGGAAEIFECRFSYKGFQYVRITVDDGVSIDQVEAIPVHTDVESTGEFSCSNPVINRIQQNSVNSLLNNYHGIATDCPHREKQGWTADNYMSAQAAMYNFNMAAFYSKWLTDLAGTQSEAGGLGTVAPSTNYDQNASTVWPAAIVFVPRDLLGFYADTLPMRRNHEVMVRFARSSLLRQVPGKPEIITDVLGDWLAPMMTLSDIAQNNTMAPPEGLALYGTASHYLIVKRLAEITAILGKTGDAVEMSDWANRIAVSFNKEFFNNQKNIYQGDQPTDYRQSANIVPLDYGLVPRENEDAVLDNLIQDIHAKGNRLGTGFLGTMSMMDYLPARYPELAYKIATQQEYPGWGYMIAQGANSMWESWDGYNSRNHTPFCLISGYFYKYLAGIQPDFKAPGFKHVIINPSIVGDLKFVSAWHDSMYGRIKSVWKLENGLLSMDISIPVNTTATIYVPAIAGCEITESGNPAGKSTGVVFVRVDNGKSVFRVGSGSYSFQSVIQ